MSASWQVNLITVFLTGVMLLPLTIGIFRPLTAQRLFTALQTMSSLVSITTAVVCAVLLTVLLFSNGGENSLGTILKNIPSLWLAIVNEDVLIFTLILLLLMVLIYAGLQLLRLPVEQHLLYPVSLLCGRFLERLGDKVTRFLGALWQLPKAMALLLGFVFLLNFYGVLTNNAGLTAYIQKSILYRLVDGVAVKPLLNTEAAQRIPELITGTVDKAVSCLSPEGRRLLIRVYINGVTVEEAIGSDPDIDNVAIDLVGAETNTRTKARILYQWVAENISYDQEKAQALEDNSFGVRSGAQEAFSSKKGVCFDKACLYVAMCRTVGVPVRLLTGLAYDGKCWQDHSWNEIYDSEEDRWITVDTTFGNEDAVYFDRVDFEVDHTVREMQGEW